VFTGIIEELGKVKIFRRGPQVSLEIEAHQVLPDLKIGDSVSVDGVCLTVTNTTRETFKAEVSAETLRRTTLGNLRIGEVVNLERPVALGERLGGHMVNGHVDGVGVIRVKKRQRNSFLLKIEIVKELAQYLVPKGSIAVDGVSLTIVNVADGAFTTSIIPHTAKATTLGIKCPGAKVNIEIDIISKYVEKLVRR
jgi:riboflavin synthase